ncbi:HAD-IIB family hydrolase [Nonomuraea sp. NPDC050790]|uniref:HAD-IIB family hydrolase n=1 Tax=Nonomuraea sp. NPDC050790 TaxID=3364371 RepID=UPI0037B080D2
MRYKALACDYDETLARKGHVSEEAIDALERLSRAGMFVLLVTGRELDDLLEVFPQRDLFDLIIAENGGVLHDPAQRTTQPLAEPLPAALVDRLRAEGVTPLGVGQVIVATREPYDTQVLAAIRELGLEAQVIYNKGAVMVLPPNVNKASGLAAGLERLGLSPHNVAAVGDAENDHAFLSFAECGVAVANALPALKERCDLVLRHEAGQGVAELAEMLLSGELDEYAIERHAVLLGHREDEEEVRLPPYGSGMVVAGPSGSGKSTVTTALLERLLEAGHQCVVVDPEGDYAEFEAMNVLGDPHQPPGMDEVLGILEQPEQSVVVNLIGMPLRERPGYFAELLPRLASMRARLGHPHWLMVDEAHHLMPAELQRVPLKDAADIGALLMITVHPEALSPDALRLVDQCVAVGEGQVDTLGAFADALGHERPDLPPGQEDSGQIALWPVGQEAIRLTLRPGEAERTRHRRKYAEGTMSKDKSFYFTGAQDKLRLRARNLHSFAELADGVDDETWLHHLRAGDYSAWIRASIRDEQLADAVARVEGDDGADDGTLGRERVRKLIEERYTLPAEPTSFDPDHDD